MATHRSCVSRYELLAHWASYVPLTPQSVFLKSNVLNYHAILDTALDVAKAMCHLHAMNVLHSDLKVDRHPPLCHSRF